MIAKKEIWIEKFTDFLPSYMLSYDNHTNETLSQCTTNIVSLQQYCDTERLNFLGIATPPYNPYGAEFDYAAVFEELDYGYRVVWHHCSRKWINQFLKELGCTLL